MRIEDVYASFDGDDFAAVVEERESCRADPAAPETSSAGRRRRSDAPDDARARQAAASGGHGGRRSADAPAEAVAAAGHGSCPRRSVIQARGAEAAGTAAAGMAAASAAQQISDSSPRDPAVAGLGAVLVRTAEPGRSERSWSQARGAGGAWDRGWEEKDGAAWHSSGLPRTTGQMRRLEAALSALRAPRDLRP